MPLNLGTPGIGGATRMPPIKPPNRPSTRPPGGTPYPNVDPGLSPTPFGITQKELQQLLKLLGPMDPYYQPASREQLFGQAGDYVRAQTEPFMDQIRASIEGRARSGMAAIGGLTRDLMGSIAPMTGEIEAAYGRARGSEETAASALRGSLQSAGQEAGAGLLSELTARGAPESALATAADMTTGAGAALGGEVGARSYAGLSNLIASGAADVSAGQRLTGIYGLTGAEHGRNLQAQLSSELTGALGEISARIPGLTQDILQTLTGREAEKAGARSDWRGQRAGIAADLFGDRRSAELQKSIARTGFEQAKAEFLQAQTQYERDLAYQKMVDAKNQAYDYYNANLDYESVQLQNAGLTPASEATNRSAGVVMGYDQAGNLVPMPGPGGKPIPYKPKPAAGATGDSKRDQFLAVREDAFNRAADLRKIAGITVQGMKNRLWAEFAPLLRQAGYSANAIKAMIARAVAANPPKTGGATGGGLDEGFAP